MKYIGKIPQSQQDIIVKSLRVYKEFLDTLPNKDRLDINFRNFDIKTLIAIFKDMKVDINYKLDQEIFDSFALRNGIDFPEYNKF